MLEDAVNRCPAVFLRYALRPSSGLTKGVRRSVSGYSREGDKDVESRDKEIEREVGMSVITILIIIVLVLLALYLFRRVF